MAEQIKVQKSIYSLSDFNNVVNTSFSQLVKPTKDTSINPDMTVPEFFNEYDILFYLMGQKYVTQQNLLVNQNYESYF